MFRVFGIYKKEVKAKEVSGVRGSEVSDSQDKEIRAIEPAERKATEILKTPFEDARSEINSDTDSDDSDDTDYDAIYSDGTDSDVLGTDGESSDDSSSEDEGSSRPSKMRVPSLAELCLHFQSRPNTTRVHEKPTSTAVIMPRREHDKQHLMEKVAGLFGPEAQIHGPSVPIVKT